MASITRLNEEAESAVIKYAETGMGYQLFETGAGFYALVIASLISVNFQRRSELFELLPRANQLLLVESGQLPPDETNSIDTDGRQQWGDLLTRHDYTVFYLLHAGIPFPPMPPPPPVRPIELFYSMPGGRPELFFRYSARRDDPRIYKNGRVKEETYATTFNDIRMVPSGLAAVGRYALPVSASAQFMFPIMSDEPYRMGTALPHYGQAGGGVEVFFKDEFQTRIATPHQIPLG